MKNKRRQVRTALTITDEEFYEALMSQPKGKMAKFIVACAEAGFHGGKIEELEGGTEEEIGNSLFV